VAVAILAIVALIAWRATAAMSDSEARLAGETARWRHLDALLTRIEADMREAILDKPRHQWLGPLWRGLRHPGLRRKSAERALKLLLPRRWFGR